MIKVHKWKTLGGGQFYPQSLVNKGKNHKNLAIDSFCGFYFGFTLIEVIAIIILLSVIALITYPVINNLISESREDLYNKQISELEKLSDTWVTKNINKLKIVDGYSYNLSFTELYESGLLSKEEVKNPKTGENLDGCIKVVYKASDKEFETKYDSTCTISGEIKNPSINLTVNTGILNSSGIATNDFDVNVIGTNITSYTYCVGNNECEPTIKVNNSIGTITINNEGTTYVCVIGSSEDKNTNKLCKSYKLEKTAVVLGQLVIDGTKGLNDWYVSDVNLSVVDVAGMTSTLNINKITEDTIGTDVVLTTTASNGKTESKTYTIKVDKTKPTAGTLNINGIKGLNDWYTSDVNFTVNNGTDTTSGHLSTTSNISSITSNTTGTVVTVTTTDNAGNTSIRNYTIKINKDKPTVGTLVINGTKGLNDWYVSDVNLSVTDVEGVSSTLNINSITEDTAGTDVIVTSTNPETGAVTTKTHTIKVDKTAPTIKITNPSNGNWTNEGILMEVNFDDTASGISPETLIWKCIWTDGNSFGWANTNNTSTTTYSEEWYEIGERTGYYKVCDKAGNCNTDSTIVRIETTPPTVPIVTYNSGTNTCSWQTDYDLTLNSTDDTSGILKYQIDWDGDGVPDYELTSSNFIPWDGYFSCINRFRAVDVAGNVSDWTGEYHIHKDASKPIFVKSWYGTVDDNIAQLYIQASDTNVDTYKIGDLKVQCPTSTVDGSYNNWYWFNAVWDSSQNAYRCDITPSTFKHFNQTYATHIYMYDHAGNGGFYAETTTTIPADSTRPTLINSWYGTVNADIAQLYIQASDNDEISKVQCPTSTTDGSYNNWHWFDAVWDSSSNAYRCDITPSTFNHYNQTYKTHIYMYDKTGNGGSYIEKTTTIPKNVKFQPYVSSECTVTINDPSSETNPTICEIPQSSNQSIYAGVTIIKDFQVGDVIEVDYMIDRNDTSGAYMDLILLTNNTSKTLESGYSMSKDRKQKQYTLTSSSNMVTIVFSKSDSTSTKYFGKMYIYSITINGEKVL